MGKSLPGAHSEHALEANGAACSDHKAQAVLHQRAVRALRAYGVEDSAAAVDETNSQDASTEAVPSGAALRSSRYVANGIFLCSYVWLRVAGSAAHVWGLDALVLVVQIHSAEHAVCGCRQASTGRVP